jgi:hypothetical protein
VTDPLWSVEGLIAIWEANERRRAAQGVDMPEVIRCPYCEEIMRVGTEGDWFFYSNLRKSLGERL